MVAWAYIMFEVERPTIVVEELNDRESMWRTTAEALSAAGTSMSEIVQGVTEVNEGPGAHKFAEFMAGIFASPDAIGKAKDDAGEFAAACAAAARELTETVTAMDAITDIVDAKYSSYAALISGNGGGLPDPYSYAQTKCKDMERRMLDLQKSAVEKIGNIFSFAVDIPLDV